MITRFPFFPFNVHGYKKWEKETKGSTAQFSSTLFCTQFKSLAKQFRSVSCIRTHSPQFITIDVWARLGMKDLNPWWLIHDCHSLALVKIKKKCLQ